MQKYITLSGTDIEYPDPSPELKAFIEQAEALVKDKRSTASDLVALIYGPDNPIMGTHPLFPGKGYVTREVFDNPVYAVLSDLLVRKQVADAGVDPQSLGKKYTLTVTEAAERLGISEVSIRKAVQERRLPAWRRPGERGLWLAPKDLLALDFGSRGKKDAAGLKYKVGYDAESKTSFRFRFAPGSEKNPARELFDSGTVTEWRRALVLTGKGGSLRASYLIPGDKAEKIAEGSFFVSGKFTISMKINNPKAAREAWEAFSP